MTRVCVLSDAESGCRAQQKALCNGTHPTAGLYANAIYVIVTVGHLTKKRVRLC